MERENKIRPQVSSVNPPPLSVTAAGGLSLSSELKLTWGTKQLSEASHLRWQWWVFWGCCWGQICGFLPGNCTEVHLGLRACLLMPFWPSCPIHHSSSKGREYERNGLTTHPEATRHLSAVETSFMLLHWKTHSNVHPLPKFGLVPLLFSTVRHTQNW